MSDQDKAEKVTLSYIAHLDLAINASLTGARWQEIARESGTPLRAYDGPPGPNNIEPFIRDALGLVLPYENFLLEESLRACISETVTNGKRLLVYLDPNSLTALNPFLAAYDIEGTNIAAYVVRPELAHPGLTTIERSESPESFELTCSLMELTNSCSDSLPRYAMVAWRPR